MAHPLISTIVIALALAWVFGALAHRLRLPPLVGYLIAGVLIGPATPGFVADQTLASELAEIGVILLMFGVGLHFSLEHLLSVRAIAVPGAIAQIACATLLGMALAALARLVDRRRPRIRPGAVGRRAPWSCCARSRSGGWSKPGAAASPSAGSSSRTW